MKKNNSKLLHFLLCALVLCLVTVFAGLNLTESLHYDNEYGVPTDVVFTVNSDAEETVKNTAEVLEKRFANFGASYTSSTIEGSKVTVKVIGIDNFDDIKDWIVKPGVLSFRDYDDKLLMDASVLNADIPLAITYDSSKTYIILNIEDGEEFKDATVEIMNRDENKYLVMWMDYLPSQSFVKEAEKDNPAFLVGATVSSAISESCYIATHHELDETKKYIAVIDSGALPVSVTIDEIKTHETGENSMKSFMTVTYCVLGAVALIGALIYGLPGFLTAVSGLGYTLAYFRGMALLDITFNRYQLVVFALSLAFGIAMSMYALGKFRKELLRGRNLNASIEDAYREELIAFWEAPIVEIVVALMGMIIFRSSIADMAACVIAGGVGSLIFFTLINKTMISSLIASNYFNDKALYGVKVSELPDVEKGEDAIQQKQLFDFSSLLKGKIIYLIAAVLCVAGAAVAFTKYEATSSALLHVCVIGGIGIILTALYDSLRYKKHYPLAAVIAGIAALAAASLFTLTLTGADYKGQAIALVAPAVALALSALISFDLRRAYRSISREKLTQDKLIGKANGILNDTIIPVCCMMLVTALTAGIKNIPCAILLVITVYLCGVLLPIKMWTDNAAKYQKAVRKPRKSNKKELKERTIFGINEERR